MTRFLIAMLASALAGTAGAQVYRWVDDSGRVHYSNAVPPANARPALVGADARGGFASTAPLLAESADAAEARDAAAPLADAVPAPRGLEFRKYLSIRRGMTEGELLAVAGEPDLRRHSRAIDTYTYMPTPADPYVTTVTLVRGRVNAIARERSS
jgi:hypothetical protein